MTVSDQEIATRSRVFMICMALGLLLMPLSLWLFTLFLSGLAAIGISLPDWLSNLLGLAAAFLPIVLIVQRARKFLHQRYPDSPSRLIPDP